MSEQIPGESLSVGEHIVKYVAIDQDNQNSKCEFTISVRGLNFILYKATNYNQNKSYTFAYSRIPTES